MSKAVLMSIQPKWCELIANGKKTVEVRKTKPKLNTPFKVYIYCTKSQSILLDVIDDGDRIFGEIYHGKKLFIKTEDGSVCDMYGKRKKVIGEFVCDVIYEIHDWMLDPRGVYQEVEEENLRKLLKMSQFTYDELCLYRNGMPYYKPLYAWHISDLVIYDKPKELSEFTGLRKTKFGYEPVKMQRPPQSWCYVEEWRP